jgi:hypothetical protein
LINRGNAEGEGGISQSIDSGSGILDSAGKWGVIIGLILALIAAWGLGGFEKVKEIFSPQQQEQTTPNPTKSPINPEKSPNSTPKVNKPQSSPAQPQKQIIPNPTTSP